MAVTTNTVIVPTILGQEITSSTGLASGDTITIDFQSAQGMLDTKTLMVRCANTLSAGTMTMTIGVGTEGSDIGRGSQACTAIGSDDTVIIGGQDFDSARFLTSAGTIVLTMAGGCTDCTFEAYQIPRASQ